MVAHAFINSCRAWRSYNKSSFLRYISFPFFLFILLLLSPLTVSANDPFLRNEYALELLSKGDYDKALEQLQKAFSLYPYDETLRKNLAVAYMYVGKKELENSRYQEAAEYFDHARELAPENAVYVTMRGVAFYLGKNYDAARFELERALQLGESVDLHYFLGRTYYDTGNLEAAMDSLGKALALEPANKPIADLYEKIKREIAVESKMGKGHSSKFEISYDAEATSSLADDILDALETAYNRAGSDLDYFPNGRVPVILYTKKDYRVVTSSPEWSGGLYDGKIRLPIGGALEIGPHLRSVLSHEYSHVVVHGISRGNAPVWLNEGLAEYQGRRELDPPMTELTQAVKAGRLVDFRSLEGSFGGFNSSQAVLAYQQSYSIVKFMINAYGWYNVKEILVNLGKKMPLETAIAKALEGFGLDYADVVQEWRTYIGKEFGN